MATIQNKPMVTPVKFYTDTQDLAKENSPLLQWVHNTPTGDKMTTVKMKSPNSGQIFCLDYIDLGNYYAPGNILSRRSIDSSAINYEQFPSRLMRFFVFETREVSFSFAVAGCPAVACLPQELISATCRLSVLVDNGIVIRNSGSYRINRRFNVDVTGGLTPIPPMINDLLGLLKKSENDTDKPPLPSPTYRWLQDVCKIGIIADSDGNPLFADFIAGQLDMLNAAERQEWAKFLQDQHGRLQGLAMIYQTLAHILLENK